MGFFEDIFGKAKQIVNSGKDVLRDQLSSETEYRRDSTGQMREVSTSDKVFGQDSNRSPVPLPKILTTARKIGLGETAKERLDRIQNERRQTLLPDVAAKAVAEDAGKEYLQAIGGMTDEGGYDPSKVTFIGAPFAGAVGRVKRTVGRMNLRPNEIDAVEQFIDLSRGVSNLDKESAKTVREVAQNAANRLQLDERASGDKTLANAFERVLQNKGEAPTPPAKPPKDPNAPSLGPNEFERSFSKRVREANPDANLEPQLDTRRNTAELAARADEIIKRGDHNAYMDDIRSGNNVSDEHIAVASQLLNRYSSELDSTTDSFRKSELYENIADVANDTAAQLTEAGRTIQAATILGKVTPEGTVPRRS